MRFEVDGELEPIQVCHCSQCRKAQGTPIATNMTVDETAFRLLQRDELLSAYEASPGKRRVFCGRCGSPVYSCRDSLPGKLRLRVGLLNEPLPVRPVAHFYVGSGANWWSITDDLPQFQAAYEPPKKENA
ncbi:MAG: GFA family protein [Ectothiorhodospiraceae bacterium]|nr:GFA family protein [Ectothiorhodospiraceae bacterium]